MGTLKDCFNRKARRERAAEDLLFWIFVLMLLEIERDAQSQIFIAAPRPFRPG